MPPWSLILLISEWGIRLWMLPIVVRRRRPTVAMAWLLVIFFEPWIGLLLYLLFGEMRLPRRRIRKHAEALEKIARAGKIAETAPHVSRPMVDPEHAPLITLAERLGRMPILGGNNAELMADTQVVIDRLIEDIDAAQHHVHLLFYIYAHDETGRRVAEALARAEQRGVQCRVLADWAGSRAMFKKLGPWMTQQKIDLKPILPVNPLRRKLARMDLRNHRKIAVIDGTIGYTGSQNIVDPTYGTKKMTWYDMMVRLTGPAVLQLQGVFLEDWYFETDVILDTPDIFPEPVLGGFVDIQTLPSGPTYPTENYQLIVLAALHAAKQRVIITSPYLVPDQSVIDALEVAVMRGVQVDMIVPYKSDTMLTNAAGRAYYDDLLDCGVNIYRHTEGLLHAKTMCVDDAFALIGSGNFDIRSFYLNFELNLLLYGSRITAELRNAQEKYIAQSQKLTAEQWAQRPKLRRLVDDAAKVLSPLL